MTSVQGVRDESKNNEQPYIDDTEVSLTSNQDQTLNASKITHPHPIVYEEIPVEDPSAQYIPGKMIVDKSGQLLLRYMTVRGISKDIIEGFNNFIFHRIPAILQTKPIKRYDQNNKLIDYFILNNPKLIRPQRITTAPDGTEIEEELLPYDARRMKMSYTFTLEADLEHRDSVGRIIFNGMTKRMPMTLTGVYPDGSHVLYRIVNNQYQIVEPTEYGTRSVTRMVNGQPTNIEEYIFKFAMNPITNKQVIYELDSEDQYVPPYTDDDGYLLTGGMRQTKTIRVAQIPAMLGSEIDNLVHHDLTNMSRRQRDERLLKMGECIQDPYGYFIINGQERMILTQDLLRTNRILVYNHRDGYPICQITSESIKGTVPVLMYQDIDMTMRLYFPLLQRDSRGILSGGGKGKNDNTKIASGHETVNVFNIFKVLGSYILGLDDQGQNFEFYQNPIETVRYILSFVNDDDQGSHKNEIIRILNPSFQDVYEESVDPYEEIYEKSLLKKQWIKNYKSKKVPVSDPVNNQEYWPNIIDTIRLETITKLFSHIDINLAQTVDQMAVAAQRKAMLLAMMIAHLAEHLAGFRELDDRDNWANKRLVGAGSLMEQLFKQSFEDSIETVKRKIVGTNSRRRRLMNGSYTQPSSHPVPATLFNIERIIREENITDDMIKSFIPNKWGPRQRSGGIRREKYKNVTDRLDRGQSIISTMAHLMRVNAPTNRRTMNSSIRSVQTSQIGYIDAVATPSGDSIGLVKNKTITCWISVQRSTSKVEAVLDRNGNPVYKSKFDPDTHPYPVILNGFPLGWAESGTVRNLIVQARRSGLIDFDTSVVIDYNGYKRSTKGVVYIFTDANRPTRPLLVVHKNEPIIKTKNLYQADFDDIIRQGAMEYLDAWEVSKHATIATSIHDLLHINQDLERNRILVDKLEARLTSWSEKIKWIARPENKTNKELNDIIAEYNQNNVSPDLDQATLIWLKLAAAIDRDQKRLGRARETIKLLSNKRYTHVEVDPTAILGVASSAIPFIGNNPGPRNTYQCNMFAQAIGVPHSIPQNQFNTTDRQLLYPAKPLVGTMMQKYLGLDDLPAGQNIILAILTMSHNEEDSIVVKKEALERGLFSYTIRTSSNITLSERTQPLLDDEGKRIGSYTDRLVKPVQPFPGHQASDYDTIDERGLAIPDMLASEGSCLVGAVRIIRRDNAVEQELKDISLYVKTWEDGLIETVDLSTTGKGELSINVRVQKVGRPVIGDKVATRAAQKSVIGRVARTIDLPFTEDGTVADFYLNPHAVPKRMTISTLLEIVTSKYGALADERINATAFRPFDIDSYRQLLLTIYGYEIAGTEHMINPITGEPIPSEIMIGPSYYQLLKHQVGKKVNVRSEGKMNILTGQAVKGRKQKGGGGIRYGEGSSNASIASGAANFVHERMFNTADARTAYYCKNCRDITNVELIRSEVSCIRCRTDQVEVCKIPHTMQVLRNFMSAAGIQTKVSKNSLELDESDDELESSQFMPNNVQEVPLEINTPNLVDEYEMTIA